jgi:hypothetical protein
MQNLARILAILTEVFCGFPHSLQENAGIVLQMTTSFHIPVHVDVQPLSGQVLLQ